MCTVLPGYSLIGRLQAKDSALTGESLHIALSVANKEEVILTLNMANEEINKIKRLGTTGEWVWLSIIIINSFLTEQHHLELSSLSELSTNLSEMKETGIVSY